MSKKAIIGKEKDLSDKLEDKSVKETADILPSKTVPTKLPPVKITAKPVPKSASKSVAPAAPTIVKKPLQARVIPAAVEKSKSVSNTKSTSKVLPTIADTSSSKPSSSAVMKTKVTKASKVEIPPENETYFVYLKRPLEYRRHLLESSRKILFCLKSHQKIFLIREKKLEEMRKLRANVKELLYLNKKFNEKLPKYKTEFLGIAPKDNKDKKVLQSYPKVSKPVEIREKTEMEKLEESLANIEKKLKMLQ